MLDSVGLDAKRWQPVLDVYCAQSTEYTVADDRTIMLYIVNHISN